MKRPSGQARLAADTILRLGVQVKRRLTREDDGSGFVGWWNW
jgi:hypothetical protein